MIALHQPVATRRSTVVILAIVLVAVGCSRPPERPVDGSRPLDGAPPSAGNASARAGPPPTLAPAAALLVTPTPAAATVSPVASPLAVAAGASPTVYPIISNLQPAPGASLPVGDVVVGARITTSADLVDLVIFLNDEPIPQDVSRAGDRVKSVSLVRTLTSGSYDVRVQARDQLGQLGGYRWQFNVGSGARQAGATPPPRPPIAVPTVGPPATSTTGRTPAPAPSPTARAAGR